MKKKEHSRADFLIITALEEERDAVLAKLSGPTRLPPSSEDVRTYYRADILAKYPGGSEITYQVALITLLGMGRVEAANATGDAIRRWKPQCVVLVGIAGGISRNGVGLGDIIVADQVIDYELQKVTGSGVEIRYSVHRCEPRLLGAVQALETNLWESLITAMRPTSGTPQRFIGPVASGDKVVAVADRLEKLQKEWPKLVGVEMEAGGVASSASQSVLKPGFLMVRGISDLADENKDSHTAAGWRLYACDVAASFAISILKSAPLPVAFEDEGDTHIIDVGIVNNNRFRASPAADGDITITDNQDTAEQPGIGELPFGTT